MTQCDVTACSACGGAGHVSATDDYDDDSIATWHLTAECDGGERCCSIKPVKHATKRPALNEIKCRRCVDSGRFFSTWSGCYVNCECPAGREMDAIGDNDDDPGDAPRDWGDL